MPEGSGPFKEREARSLSERWPAGPLPVRFKRFKAINSR